MRDRAAYFRAYRARRKAEGAPVRSGPSGARRKQPSHNPRIIAWDGEGITFRESTFTGSVAEYHAAVRDRVEFLQEQWRFRREPVLAALREMTGSRYNLKAIIPMEDTRHDIPPQYLKTKRAHPAGNIDVVAQAASSHAGYTITPDDVVDILREHSPKHNGARQAVEEELAREMIGEAPDHRYVMLCNSLGDSIINSGGLSSYAALSLLCDTAKANPNAIHVLFGGSYDVVKILKDVPLPMLRDLYAGFPIDVMLEGTIFRLQYRQRKRLRIARLGSRLKFKRHRHRWSLDCDVALTLWDTLGFFQARFVDALKAYGIDPPGMSVSQIAAMKERRSTFTESDVPAMRDYCIAECRALVLLVGALLNAFRDARLTLNAYDGAGAAAAALLKRENVKAHVRDLDDRERDLLDRAYFGGRIELTSIGTGSVREYDIVSAYPAALEHLPSMEGTWLTGLRSPWALYRVRFAFPKDLPWYPLPYRTSTGAVLFPQTGEGIYCVPEFAAASAFVDRFGGFLDSEAVLSFVPDDEGARPFGFVREVFEERARCKREGNAAEKALKLALNSCYGKTAQTLGSDRRRPPYRSPFWATWITGFTRARLVQTALPRADDVVAFATDALYVRGNAPVSLTGDSLGDWSGGTQSEAVFVQPGVYWLRKPDGAWKPKYRGFDRESVQTPERVFEAWRRKETRLALAVTRFVTYGSAFASDLLLPHLGTWRTHYRTLDITGRGAKRGGVGTSGRLCASFAELPVAPNREYQLTGEPSHAFRSEERTEDLVPANTIEAEEEESFQA